VHYRPVVYCVWLRAGFHEYRGKGVATWWTGVIMSTPVLPKVVPEIDVNPANFYVWERVWGRSCVELDSTVCKIRRESGELFCLIWTSKSRTFQLQECFTPTPTWHEQRRCSCAMRLVALYKCYMPLPQCSTASPQTWTRTCGGHTRTSSLESPMTRCSGVEDADEAATVGRGSVPALCSALEGR